MPNKTNLKLDLSESEKKRLKELKLKQSDLVDYVPDELEVVLDVPIQRAMEIHALAEFQQIPSIGIKFAQDLVFLGYYDLDSLKDKSGAKLLDEYEKKKGFQTDPCVEDQFRLVVDYADHGNRNKQWWDFTQERKEYRAKHGYPKNRPTVKWTEVDS